MEFTASGLPDHPDIRKAFKHAYDAATSVANRRDTEQQLRARAEGWLKNNLDALQYSDAEPAQTQRMRDALQKTFDMHIASMPEQVRQNVEGTFVLTNIATALIVQTMATQSSPEFIALALLMPSVQSAKDVRNIEKDFGAAYGSILADIDHIHSYKAVQNELLQASVPQVRALFLAGEICNVQNLVRHYTQQKSKNAELPSIADSQVIDFLENLKAARGADAGLEKHFVSYVNKLCELLSSPHRLDISGAAPKIISVQPPGDSNGLMPNFDPQNPNMWN